MGAWVGVGSWLGRRRAAARGWVRRARLDQARARARLCAARDGAPCRVTSGSVGP
jgi:hypothetical protein